MKVSVVISTYNSPEWLLKVLWGYSCQTVLDFELLIADDGSGPETASTIREFEAASCLTIKHVWHEDAGFRKCTILNKAIAEASGDYLIFTDGDCVPRNDFVATHLANAEPGRFLSGGAIRLPLGLSEAITEDDIMTQRAFDYSWLRAGGMQSTHKTRKIKHHGRKAEILNFLTPTNASWNGGNSSAFKADLLAVNGYDERLEWGGEDRELGDRLENFGLRGKQVRFTAQCVHLDHGRPYKDDEKVKFNKKIRKKSQLQKSVWTPWGIEKKDSSSGH